jgi:hypothetical protein
MPEFARVEYARLQLLQEVETANGGKSREIVFYRPNAKQLFDSLAHTSVAKRIEEFVSINARALNGSDKAEEFKAGDLASGDVVEIIDLMTSLQGEADSVVLGEGDGDGVNSPITYTLRHPIHLTPGKDDGDVIHQIQFEGRTLGDLSEFLDASGERQEFSLFMRLFGKLLGTTLPMTDAVINALDFVDYYAIRRKIMGKLVASRERWKKASIS